MKRYGVGLLVCVFLLGMCAVPVSAAPESLSSLSAVLYEPQSGRFLYDKGGDAPRPIASTTKLMTALVAVEHLSLETVVTVSQQAVMVEGSSMGLRAGDRLTVKDLLTGLLLSSGNDAANTLALTVSGSLPAFAELMNKKAEALGMTDTCFVTPSGLDEGDHHSTARDMAYLAAAVLERPELAAVCAKKSAVITFEQPEKQVTVYNHNRLLNLYPSSIGLKTGYTQKSGKCLVSAARQDGVTLIVVTLNGGDYWNDHIKLYNYGFDHTVAVSLPSPSSSSVAVAGGTTDRVCITADTLPTAVLLKEEQEQLSCRVELPPFLWAPVHEGDVVGKAVYHVNGRAVGECSLIAEESVPCRPLKTMTEKWKQWTMLLFREWLR